MEYDIVTADGFYVAGKSIMTTNAENKFGRIWEDFFKTYHGGQIVGVYADYESDFRGKFSFTVGVIADETAGARFVPGGKFARFKLADRSMVGEAWGFVWQCGLARAYAADFERYNEDGSVELYISLK